MPINVFNTFDDPSGITGSTQAFGVNDMLGLTLPIGCPRSLIIE
jgi:hypothetical protein